MKTININALKVAIVAVLLATTFNSCKKENVKLSELSIQKADKELYNALLESGIKAKNIVELKEYYLVEGDLLFKKNKTDLKKVSAYFGNENSKQTLLQEQIVSKGKISSIRGNKIAQWQTSSLISSFNVENIKILTSSVQNSWVVGIWNALRNWSSIPSCQVGFYTDWTLSVTNVEPNTITFTDATTDPELNGYYAISEFPTNDNAGFRIRINGNLYNSLSDSQKIYILTHEIGHCLGFRHTDNPGNDSFGTIQIPGTPTSDPNSVMNSGSYNSVVPNWSSFSTYDVIAAQTLYPPGPYDSCIIGDFVNYIDPDNYSFNLQWNNAMLATSTVTLQLYQYGIFKATIASNIPNNGNALIAPIGLASFVTNTFPQLQIKIIADDDPGRFDYSQMFYYTSN
ncbi:hypothetical protein DU508_12500 [Pedobacter chinensis]|uniref:Dual-action HEIGH metallo-peptidase n=1 Tax=Pedobacter chinensis TaxID=2282421 RepID=A0A369PV09_9SPHI|nr:M57 family metalloprotease [Pedobacter chinensis]RDC56413.1 hypothetical protein DU508_12500 [Pedobacter chinensis]